jgi:hypothetical protein
MAMAALVLLLAAVSHAQQSLDQVLSQKLDTTTGLAVDAASKVDKPKSKVSVPEPSTSVLLLIGLGVTGLVGYRVERRKCEA